MGPQICFHQNLWLLVKIWWHFFKLCFEMVFSISFLQKRWLFFLSVLLETSIIKPNSFQVDCHLNGDCHDLALKRHGLEANVTVAPGKKRPSSSITIDEAINNNSEEVYKCMVRTAWNMANTPSLPHSHFSVLVKCQRENGVCLVEGRDNNKVGL